jgi:YidC/Oxa1 family membrane protein insertase
MQQKRLLIALLLSSVILIAWTYFFPAPKPKNPPQETAATPSATAAPNPSQQGASQQAASQQAPVSTASSSTLSTAINQAPQRTITVNTNLYTVKLDSRGGEPISWIIRKNKYNNAEIFSVAGRKSERKDLELISPEGLNRQPRQVPFQLQTGDATLDNVLASSTYRVEGVDGNSDVEVNLGAGEKKQLTFVLEDANGLEVRKTIGFDASEYATNLSISVKRGGAVVPNVKMTIGPSISDQGVRHHTFYSVAPESVAYVNDKLERHTAASINTSSGTPDKLVLNGPVDWAGVADTYFAMVAIPTQHVDGLEYKTVAYEYKPNSGTPEKRYLVTAFVPVPSDGSSTIVYTGPKDHYLLTNASNDISKLVQRPVDLERLIDYGFLGWLSRPLAVPILQAISYLYRLTSSYGLAIILFTIVIYSLFFPLKWRSSRAMKKAQALAPRMKELQEKIKGMKQSDPRLKELQMEQLRLMREGNPLGGCLPLLIQMPFLFALYRAITISLDFRQASFLWIPDLSAAEPYMIHLLPILMTGTMVVLQLVTPAPSTDPLQRKMMAVGMPLFMLYILWSAPSGLVLYWLVGNIVGFAQQFLINHWTKSDDDKVESPPAKQVPARKKQVDSATART